MIDNTKRRLSSSLLDLVGESKPIKKTIDNLASISELDSRHKCYAVLRSKGGSGESHSTKKLVEDLKAEGKNIIVCFQDDQHISYQAKCLSIKHLSSYDSISVESNGLIKCDWTIFDHLNELILALNNSPNNFAIIFTCGTSSGGKFSERINPIAYLCESIFISVNSNVENSVNPAKDLYGDPEPFLDSVKVSWWHEPTRKVFQMGIFELRDLHHYSVDELNEQTMALDSFSLLNFG